jgi:hypothetical protein
MAVIMIFAFIALIFGAIWEPTRRKHFEWFYYSHHVTYTVLIITVLWHAAAAWMYLIPGNHFFHFHASNRLISSAGCNSLSLYLHVI